MNLEAIAARIGVSPESARQYHTKAQQNRRRGTPKFGDLPPPDARLGNTPVWDEAAIEAWVARRPGKGYGAGRPKKPRGA